MWEVAPVSAIQSKSARSCRGSESEVGSAALALAFDNFFTSVIPCASSSSTAWYNQIPRTASPENLDGLVGKHICQEQLALICLVGVGLIMYCWNLIISLFRIFEKVKYHPSSVSVR